MSGSLLIMVLTHLLVHAAGNMRTTLFPVLKEEFALTNQQVGLIVAIPSLCQFLLSVPSGMVSDRFGPKKLIAASILIAAVGARARRGCLSASSRYSSKRQRERAFILMVWSPGRESNPRPTAYKAAALATELPGRTHMNSPTPNIFLAQERRAGETGRNPLPSRSLTDTHPSLKSPSLR